VPPYSNEAAPQTDKVYHMTAGALADNSRMAPVDGEELQTVPANEYGRRSGNRSRRIGVVPEPT